MPADSSSPFRFASASLAGLQPSATLHINERVQALRAAGRDVLHLGFGESRFPVPDAVVAALREHAAERSYLPVLGLPELRAAIAAFYGRHFGLQVAAEQVVIGPGSKALLMALALATEGTVLLPTPAWVSYAPQAQLARRSVVAVPMDPTAGYALDPERLQHALQKAAANWQRPDMLLLNTPGNPLGSAQSAEALQACAEFARRNRLMVVSDEIYSLTAHNAFGSASMAAHYPEGTVVTGGLSKHLSLGGWRFGVAILPPGAAGRELAAALQIVAGEIWSCVAAPVQHAALAAYAADPAIAQHIAQSARLHGARTRVLHSVLQEFGVPCPLPDAGFYLYPNFERWRAVLAQRNVHTSAQLAAHLLEKHSIATLPGSAFHDDALTLRLSSSYLDTEQPAGGAEVFAAFARDADDCINHAHPRLQRAAAALAEFISGLGS